MGGQTPAFVFLCFCKRKMERGCKCTLLNQQMNHLLIIIYIIGTHTCFHKNTKTQRNGLARGFPSLVEEDRA